MPRVDRVPRVGGQPCLACKRFDAFLKETNEKLGLPGMVGEMVQNSQSLYSFTFNALIDIHEYIYSPLRIGQYKIWTADYGLRTTDWV